MRKTILAQGIPAAALLWILHVAPTWAAANKVWVSNAGVDNGTCGAVTLPCASLPQAHDNAAAGGEIGVLTPGDYGVATTPRLQILKSIFITDDGTGEAAILGGGDTVVIAAGAGDVVSLRGLVIDGQVNGARGVVIQSASAVHIQNCVIRNYEGTFGHGIAAIPTTSMQLFVSDTIVFNNGSVASSAAVLLQPQSTVSISAVLDRVHLEDNVIGLLVDGTQSTGDGSHVVVRDSVMSGNVSDGIRALSAAGKASAFLLLERNSSVGNVGNGILANGPRATMLLDDNTVTRNRAGISAVNSGQLISYGNNRVNNNIGADGTPTGNYSPL